MLFHFFVLLLTLPACFTITPARADNYGALAYSRSTGATGWAYDYGSRGAAEQNALRSCRKSANDCEIAVWFQNNCAAIAAGANATFGWSWADTRKSAETRALRECSKGGVQGCTVTVWACNSSGGGGAGNINACFANASIQCAAQCGGYHQPCHGQCTAGATALCK